MITIEAPYRIQPLSTFQILRLAITQDLKPTDDEICLDFSRTNFVEAAGIVSLANLIDWLRARMVTVTYTGCDPQRAAISYLDDTGFFAAFWGTPLTVYARNRSTTYPFRQLECADSHQWIDGNVFPWIANRCGVPERAFDEFKACIRELFNNIKDHSTLEIGCMHVQEYPNVSKMKIAVSDFGVGIPHEVRKVVPNISDPAAIIQATKEGFTSKPGGRNMGAGLSYLIDNVVCRNHGSVSIYSGTGQGHFRRAANGSRNESVALSQTYYPGTLVSMTLRTDMIVVPQEDSGEEPW